MKHRLNKADCITLIAFRIKWSILLLLIMITGIIRFLMQKKTDPLDEGIITRKEIIGMAEVRDTSSCGFDVVYSTKEEVTGRRAEEIRLRPHIKETIRRLEKEAPLHFGAMLHTDIYEFAEFARDYELDPDVRILNIRVAGIEKCRLYIGNNPNIENSARWFNSNTQQGVLYITNIDVYKRYEKPKRVYRYWKCYGLNETSSIDEHFSHFSEDERID